MSPRSPTSAQAALALQQVNTGFFHGYCWGIAPDGQLGTGTTTGSLTPVAVAGPM